jgi:hypothetical protein
MRRRFASRPVLLIAFTGVAAAFAAFWHPTSLRSPHPQSSPSESESALTALQDRFNQNPRYALGEQDLQVLRSQGLLNGDSPPGSLQALFKKK